MNKDEIVNYFSFKDDTFKFTQNLIYNHWLSDEDYNKYWKEKINLFFEIEENKIFLNPNYIVYSIWYNGFKEYILKLHKSLLELGETSFAIIEQENPLDKSKFLIKLKFDVNSDFNNIFIEGEGLNAVFQSYSSIFLIVGESGKWAELINMEDVDIIVSTEKKINIFKKYFKQ